MKKYTKLTIKINGNKKKKLVYWKNLENMVREKSLIYSISNTQYGPENKRSEKSVNAVLPQKINRKMIAFFCLFCFRSFYSCVPVLLEVCLLT